MNEINIPYRFDPNKRPFQHKVLASPARFKFLKIHRKAGKTVLAINRLIQKSYLLDQVVNWYVGPTYTQAKETVWRDPDMLFYFLPSEIVSKKNETELVITLKNGTVMGIKGADKPDSLRGPNPALVILDEVYLMKPEIWTEIISPIAFANPEMEVWFIGTPKPMGKFWHEEYEKTEQRMLAGDPEWFAMTLNAEESKILSDQMLAQARVTMTQAGYEQEYMCKYLGDEGVVFRGIDQVIYGAYQEPKTSKREWGLDLARLEDWTVLAGINQYSHKLDALDRYNQIDYNLQKAKIEAYWRRLGKGRMKVDATGVGEAIQQDLDKVGVQVEGFKFTNQFKHDLISNLAIGIEQRLLLLPNIPELVREFKMFGYEITKGGNIRYGAPEGYHDDIVIAVALAWWDIGSRLAMAKTGFLTMHGEEDKPEKVGFDHE